MIVIGTRGSQLALVQARSVSAALAEMGVENKIKILVTKGDVVQDRFDKMEGKGFFTKEIEDALLGGDIDLAVHCLKDLPTEDAPGLTINAILGAGRSGEHANSAGRGRHPIAARGTRLHPDDIRRGVQAPPGPAGSLLHVA